MRARIIDILGILLVAQAIWLVPTTAQASPVPGSVLQSEMSAADCGDCVDEDEPVPCCDDCASCACCASFAGGVTRPALESPRLDIPGSSRIPTSVFRPASGILPGIFIPPRRS